jgi:hypothetical protein
MILKVKPNCFPKQHEQMVVVMAMRRVSSEVRTESLCCYVEVIRASESSLNCINRLVLVMKTR